jgi:hypothetical protein
MPGNKSRINYLLDQLKRADGSRGTSPERAAHLSYIDDRLGEMLSPSEARMAKEDLTRRRLQGDSAKGQADAISRMSSGGKVKFNKKYTSGSGNVSERKKLMAEIAAIYKKYRGSKEKRKKKGFPPAVAARLKKLMAKRDKI